MLLGALSGRVSAMQVEEALTSEVRERAPVGVLKKQLVTLQAEVAAAHERLHTTQVRCREADEKTVIMDCMSSLQLWCCPALWMPCLVYSWLICRCCRCNDVILTMCCRNGWRRTWHASRTCKRAGACRLLLSQRRMTCATREQVSGCLRAPLWSLDEAVFKLQQVSVQYSDAG